MVTIAADTVIPDTNFGTAPDGSTIVLKVITGGDYNETDLVDCYRSDDPTKHSYCAYLAQYIATGTFPA